MVKTRHQLSVDSVDDRSRRVAGRLRQKNVLPDYTADSDIEERIYRKRRRSVSPTLPLRTLPKYSSPDSPPVPTRSLRRLEKRNYRKNGLVKHESNSREGVGIHSPESLDYMNGEISCDDGTSVRRSTRQRKFIYNNLNQSWLLTPSITDFGKLPGGGKESSPEQTEDVLPTRRNERTRTYDLRKHNVSPELPQNEYEDMYSRVKRTRRKTPHAYLRQSREKHRQAMDDSESDSGSSSEDEGTETMEEGDSADDGTNNQKYHLRPKKPMTERFQIPVVETKSKKSNGIFHTPTHTRSRDRHSFKSPAHRSPLYRRKRHAIHNSSSTSSSSDDERRFERRKARSMARARNRCLPMNFKEDDLMKGVLRERAKIGTSLADVDPMEIDKNVKFESVGGLDSHIQHLKEMILFPLVYPEVFEKFKIAPPRGVLFHGPPGTGKTLVARALANECSQGDRRVAFFMRKGADCLSKWVGESERQLRLLFDQAYSMRPSIIFFDEIDGLAPVRSTRQDQIHSSIVSTLLALMDGLDNRGEIVVIGATNRIDAIDPALRRPGRFDREFSFPLPNHESRCCILKINTSNWIPPLEPEFVSELAARCVGYCGADLKALCAEAALVALRRCFPQIYNSNKKLLLDMEAIKVTAQDFEKAMQKIVPAAQRSCGTPARPLPLSVRPLLHNTVQKAFRYLKTTFASGIKHSVAIKNDIDKEFSEDDSYASDEELKENSSFPDLIAHLNSDTSSNQPPLKTGPQYLREISSHRPRLLLCGRDDGQSTHVAPAVLHMLEHLPVHRLDLPTLFAVTSRMPEEACALIFHEAQRRVPAILYLPHICQWWDTLSETVRATFVTLLQDLDPSLPLLFLATSDVPFKELPDQVQQLFGDQCEVLNMPRPTTAERREFFSALLLRAVRPPRKKSRKEPMKELPLAPPPQPRKLTKAELEKLKQQEEATLRELRLFLREILNKLIRDRRYIIFAKPVDPEEVPDYLSVIKSPMDLETMMSKIDFQQYSTVGQFLDDINLICFNALEYNPDKDPSDKAIRHRACALRDAAHALIDSELDSEFERICQEIYEARRERGEAPTKYAPKHYHVLPQPKPEDSKSVNHSAANCDGAAQINGKRISRRIRGMDVSLSDSEVQQQPQKKKSSENKVTPGTYILVRKKTSPWFCRRRRCLVRRRIAGLHKNSSSSNNSNLVITPDSQDKRKATDVEGDRNIQRKPAPNPKRLEEEEESCTSSSLSMEFQTTMPFDPDTSLSFDGVDSSKVTRKEDNKGDTNINRVEASTSQESSSLPERPESPHELKLDKNCLKFLLDTLVKCTENCSIEKLEKLYCSLSVIAHSHRKNWDKDSMIKEMELELEKIKRNL